ncbi:actin related protein 8 [Cavenderia fasciculata]|uniref:Actin related protein 8 n=1 Tax=Cavenderia fasciculata TaxID=261658 RepID=F4Q9S3_CACFS|nr:actin related protein 8 [Cavenderia fasciculata]EGG15442.1 actin related protein 8 [Cavenderia fasciculata]|eukprot:XP_004354184.1 actin related protein 8 [Cavenderia fasciculata]
MESKVIVIHHGSYSLKIGLASDAAPKIIPNWIAKRLKIPPSSSSSSTIPIPSNQSQQTVDITTTTTDDSNDNNGVKMEIKQTTGENEQPSKDDVEMKDNDNVDGSHQPLSQNTTIVHDENNNNNQEDSTKQQQQEVEDQSGKQTTSPAITIVKTPSQSQEIIQYRVASIESIQKYIKDNISNLPLHPNDQKHNNYKYIIIPESKFISEEKIPKKRKKKPMVVDNGKPQQPLFEKPINFEQDNFCIGDDAIEISKDTNDHWMVYQPMLSPTTFNLATQSSFQALSADLIEMWKYAIQRYLNINPQDLNNYGCVYIIPDTFDKKEVKEITSLLLCELRFTSVLLYRQSVCSLFGAATGTGCVVDIGYKQISIACVDEGYLIPQSRVSLGYGGENITKLLEWLLYKNDSTPTHKPIHQYPFPIDQCNITIPFYLNLIDSIKINNLNLFINDEKKIRQSICKVKETIKSKKYKVYQFNGDIVFKVPALSLFYPKSFKEDEINNEQTSTNNNNGNNKNIGSSKQSQSRKNRLADYEELFEETMSEKTSSTDPLYPLDKAIYKSINMVGEKMDTRKKYLQNMQLVGGGSHIPGIQEIIRNRINIIHQQYQQSKFEQQQQQQQNNQQQTNNQQPQPIIEELIVLFPTTQKHDIDPTIMGWKGGAIIGCLESSREIWITRDEWKGGQNSSYILKEKLSF